MLSAGSLRLISHFPGSPFCSLSIFGDLGSVFMLDSDSPDDNQSSGWGVLGSVLASDPPNGDQSSGWGVLGSVLASDHHTGDQSSGWGDLGTELELADDQSVS